MRISAFLAASVLLLPIFFALTPTAAAADQALIVTVGDQDQMRSRNILRVFLGPASTEDWGVGILEPVYSKPLLTHPVTGELLPYIAKGVDANGDGIFETTEYGAFRKDPSTNLTDVVVYFDFNGVVWHDGLPMTVMDLFFTLQISSLSPRLNTGFVVLWDRAGSPGSNFSSDRWLAVGLAPKSWENEASIPGNPSLRVAVQFRLQEPYGRFYENTLGDLTLLPRHVFEQTGGGRHADFGRAIYPEDHPRAGEGIPTNETLYKAFDYAAAETWSPADADVIGAGPFQFAYLIPGVSTLIVRNPHYYVGRDPSNPTVVYDPRLAAFPHLPQVDAFLFRVYRTPQLGVLALMNEEIDYLRANVPPEFVPDVLSRPLVRVFAFPDPGFTYLGYNMRRPWLGYGGAPLGDPVDTGRPVRMAIARLLDKRAFVDALLQNFGVVADSVVSPANTLYYNGSIPRLPYDLGAARTILDNAGFVDSDGDGWRELPVVGDAGIEILIGQAVYDPIRFAAGTIWSTAMRAVGLNVTTRQVTLGEALQRLEARDFDMFILGWKIPDPDPDYLFPLFHCSVRDVGLNFPAYCDSALDRTIERSRTGMDPGERVRLIKMAQGLIMDDRPVEPMFYRTSLQAVSTARYTNWSSSFGTLWTYWSWIGVRPMATPQPLRIEIRYDSAMMSRGSQRIEATVKHPDGRPFAGVTVAFRILEGDGGSFTETGSLNVSGATGTAGTFAASYVAPLVSGPPREIRFQVVVSDETAGTVGRSFTISVFRETDRFLSLRVSLPAGDIGFLDTPLPVRIEVTDETGTPARDATVTATTVPANGTLTRTNGTAEQMASLLFSPPPDLGATTSYSIALAATRPGWAGYHAAYANISLLIVVPLAGPPPPPGELPTALGVGIVGAGIVGAAGLGVAALWVVRSRRRTRGRKA